MTDKLMYIHNVDTQNNFFCRLQLVVKTFWTLNSNEPTNQNSRKVLKVVSKIVSNRMLFIYIYDDLVWLRIIIGFKAIMEKAFSVMNNIYFQDFSTYSLSFHLL